jgi:hypothetical protein
MDKERNIIKTWDWLEAEQKTTTRQEGRV